MGNGKMKREIENGKFIFHFFCLFVLDLLFIMRNRWFSSISTLSSKNVQWQNSRNRVN